MNPRILLLPLVAALFAGCGKDPVTPPPEEKPQLPKKAAAKPRIEGENDKSTGDRYVTQRAANLNVLSISGGTSHDFSKWFNDNDSAGICFMAKAKVDYMESFQTLPDEILKHDVVYLSANQPLDSLSRVALMSFVDTGHGMVIIHPACWYNWLDWPEFNQRLVGGGTKSHDKYGDFVVTVENTEHAVTKDLPTSFRVTDELYHFEPDPQGTPINVLATAKNLKTGEKFPAIWVVKHPKAHIVCITLGHDGATHENPAFHTLLKNSILWAAAK
ncbi:MAG: hypothetical protein JWM68_4606 [Verrucomicrobiales bacterium]|nr:hypothetical protein [Verrucomicrobiales bacterium]